MNSPRSLQNTSLHSFSLWTPASLQIQNRRQLVFFERQAVTEQFGKELSLKRSLRCSITKHRKWWASLERDSSDSASVPTGVLNVQISSVGDDSVAAAPMKHPVELAPVTGGALDFKGATEPLTPRSLPAVKKVVLVRHGLSSCNGNNRIQSLGPSQMDRKPISNTYDLYFLTKSDF